MSSRTPEPTSSASTSRRTVLSAAAWSVPVIALAVAAPARAASTLAPVPGINGWIQFGYPTSSRGTARVTLDARGRYPERGLWINDTTAATKVTDMHLAFHFPSAAGDLSFAEEGTSAWSPLVKVGTIAIDGARYNSYRSDYTAKLPLSPGRTLIPNDFSFRSTRSVAWSGARPYIDRFVTIDGTAQSFRRQVGGNGDVLATAPYSGTRQTRLSQAEVAPASVDGALEDAEIASVVA
ncbi:hypothetical protein C5E07_10470 [Pseudoclavibacter sp. RFBJ3]|uniref:hypothetical protein n=1 Tax=unclassified Pseudoclavibacter TaxID=2615177 RepID=UPI000CE880B1|nr:MULTISPECIES: hypothetical protein [unclassified Pseudoclavibacter]PPF83899.1 hypothetical protein C5C12_09550 [Pseudoclavibacter sp. RFBJ5]PPF92179.1 hypothetical protein C5E07_10470 [Pseudoclavibacter sp. RFBJ3]PPF97042.1 hypothetical protein C5C19_13780 [Pseudoclavibacter sp. RFBH5]PPG23729.1 hypothetical protein C5E13_09165 [Pseudoclavibacter sp. RFBI4]